MAFAWREMSLVSRHEESAGRRSDLEESQIVGIGQLGRKGPCGDELGRIPQEPQDLLDVPWSEIELPPPQDGLVLLQDAQVGARSEETIDQKVEDLTAIPVRSQQA